MEHPGNAEIQKKNNCNEGMQLPHELGFCINLECAQFDHDYKNYECLLCGLNFTIDDTINLD